MRRLLLVSLMLCVPLSAAAKEKAPGPVADGKGQPVLMEAERMDYDHTGQTVIAEGKVEVTQGETVLLAETVTYDKKRDVLYAQGDVSMMDATGNVYFVDDIVLENAMKKGIASGVRARMSDNSLFAANRADRVDEDVSVLHQVVYSPCRVKCDDGSEKAPTWAVKAKHATIDQLEQTVSYEDAVVEAWGMPVFYTPYFSHATPGADNKSGILSSRYRYKKELGHIVEVPFYWAIAPDKDATLTYMHTTLEGPVLLGEYRQRFERGNMKWNMSGTMPENRNALGVPENGQKTRGHLFAQGAFEIEDNWQWGFNVRRTTDDTYLRRYDFSSDPLLTSRVYAEGFEFAGSGRSYAVAQGLAFQGLQQQDNQRTTPLVLPVVDAFYQSTPLAWNSRLTLIGGAMALSRTEGADTRRLSLGGEWMVPYITEGGHVLEASASLRADGYDVDNLSVGGGRTFSGQRGRAVPQITGTWRYPLVQRMEQSSWVVEPVVQAIASPNTGNPARIPNEDSATPEFTDTNIFSTNRFAGYDRIETGTRVNYGVRTQWQTDRDQAVSVLLGQAYRINDDPLFPISNDLRSRFSDYVGRIGVSYKPVDVAFRFRADRETLSLNRSEVQANLSLERFSFGGNYFRSVGDPTFTDKEEVSGAMGVKITPNWTWSLGGHYDLQRNSTTNTNTGLTYQNECVTLITSAGRDYTSDRDFQESTHFMAQLLLRNLD